MTTPATFAELAHALWAGCTGFVELRTVSPDRRRTGSAFFPLPLDMDAAGRVLARAKELNAAGRNVYFGVNPRLRPGGTNADVPAYVALPLDFDSVPEAAAALEKLKAWRIPPGAAVFTGRGYQFFLLLDAPTAVQLAQPVAQRLCRATGSDAVHDPARISRMPGTVNLKPAAHGAEAFVAHLDTSRRYTVEQVTAALDAAGTPLFVTAQTVSRPHGARKKEREQLYAVWPAELPAEQASRANALFAQLPARLQALTLHGHRDGDGYASRSEADFAVIRGLLDVGATDDEVETLFCLHADGIGERATEVGAEYLWDSVAKARETERPSSVLRIDSGTLAPGERLVLDVTVTEGYLAGESFRQGVSLASRGVDILGYVLWSVGLPRAIRAEQLSPALLGRTARVRLRVKPRGIEVARWLGRSAA